VIHFNNTTGKNKGKLQFTKLATYLGKTEGALRATKKRSEKELAILHLGALCEANGIFESDLKTLIIHNKQLTNHFFITTNILS
jgi:hypothetical protein